MRYKHATAHDWLSAHIEKIDTIEGLRRFAKQIAKVGLDSDEIQDEFQKEMDADGYFVDLDMMETEQFQEPPAQVDEIRRTLPHWRVR